MKKTYILALALPVLLNACSPKKKAADASTTSSSALETDGVEYCSVLGENMEATCFLELTTDGKKTYKSSASSYEALLLSPSFPDQGITFNKVEEADYKATLEGNVIPTITAKETDLRIILDPVGTDDANLRKGPGRINSMGGLSRISSSVFSAGKGTKLKSFLRSFTKGFSSGGKVSIKRVGAGGLTVISGILGLVGFGNWAKEKSQGLTARPYTSPDREATNNLEMAIIKPTSYTIEE